MTKASQTLDARIADALGNESADRTCLVALWQEALNTIDAAKQTVEAESEHALDVANPDPDASDEKARRAALTIDRLTRAIPRLKARVDQIDTAAFSDAWHAEADRLKSERDKLADELAEMYPQFVEKITDLYARIDANTAAIGNLHARAPRDECRRLSDAELAARGLQSYTAEQPRLRDNLKLPDFDRPRDIVFPPPPPLNLYFVAAEGALTAMAAKYALSCGPDWAAAKAIEDEQKRAEIAKREDALAAEAAEQKRAYFQHLLDEDRRRRGLANGS